MPESLIAIITAVVTAAATTLLAYTLIWPRAKADLEREYLSRYNEKKWSIYIEFVDYVKHLVEAGMSRDRTWMSGRPVLPEKLSGISANLLLIGSDSIVGLFRNWREVTAASGQLSKESLESISEIVLEMRKDLGNTSSELGLDEILGSVAPGFQRSIPGKDLDRQSRVPDSR
jgi:hypothetical protein